MLYNLGVQHLVILLFHFLLLKVVVTVVFKLTGGAPGINVTTWSIDTARVKVLGSANRPSYLLETNGL